MDHEGFRPRRLGHANLFVSDLERSVDFYSRICGVQLVRREPGIQAAFHSNGNTHHDIGLIQCSTGERRGINGFVQASSYRGHAPGLNHFGWEMNSEAELIAAVERAEAAGVEIANCSNHQISHSAYLPDPDGNWHEFYADVVEDWRTIFNLEREELVTERWDWKHAKPGLAPIHPPVDERHVPDALFHPVRITHAVLAVRDLAESIAYFEKVAGLVCSQRNERAAGLHGETSSLDLILIPAEGSTKAGLQAISFVVKERATLDAAERSARQYGVPIRDSQDTPIKRSVVVEDPDGILVELYAARATPLSLTNVRRAGADRTWWLAA